MKKFPEINNHPLYLKEKNKHAIASLAIESSNEGKNKKEVPILLKSGTIAIQSLLVGVHLLANSKMLSMLSNQEYGASSVVSTFQTLTTTTGSGFIFATGLEIGPMIGADKFDKAGELAKASWILSLVLGGLVSGAMVSAQGILPLLYPEENSKVASDFLLGYAACGIPSMMIVSSPQIAFQAGDWYIPLVSGVMFVIPAGFLSYVLGFSQGLGAFGVGLGGSIGGILSTLTVQAWLCQKHYARYNFYQCSMGDWKNNFRNLLKTGFQLSLQRITEWGNLFAVTTAFGLSNVNALSATPPVIDCLMIFAISMQGLAQATAMLILYNKGKTKLAIQQGSQEIVEALHKKNIRILTMNNMAGFILGVVAAGIVYAERSSISSLLMAPASADIQAMAEKFLWVGMIGSIPDAIRIISLGSLRSWKDVLLPTGACLTLMTLSGIPIGNVISEQQNDESYMFIVRNVAIALSSLMMVWRCRQKIQHDRQETLSKLLGQEEPLQSEEKPNSILSYFCCIKKRQSSLMVQNDTQKIRVSIDEKMDNLQEYAPTEKHRVNLHG